VGFRGCGAGGTIRSGGDCAVIVVVGEEPKAGADVIGDEIRSAAEVADGEILPPPLGPLLAFLFGFLRRLTLTFENSPMLLKKA
jgi:hypothetical protein